MKRLAPFGPLTDLPFWMGGPGPRAGCGLYAPAMHRGDNGLGEEGKLETMDWETVDREGHGRGREVRVGAEGGINDIRQGNGKGWKHNSDEIKEGHP